MFGNFVVVLIIVLLLILVVAFPPSFPFTQNTSIPNTTTMIPVSLTPVTPIIANNIVPNNNNTYKPNTMTQILATDDRSTSKTAMSEKSEDYKAQRGLQSKNRSNQSLVVGLVSKDDPFIPLYQKSMTRVGFQFPLIETDNFSDLTMYYNQGKRIFLGYDYSSQINAAKDWLTQHPDVTIISPYSTAPSLSGLALRLLPNDIHFAETIRAQIMYLQNKKHCLNHKQDKIGPLVVAKVGDTASLELADLLNYDKIVLDWSRDRNKLIKRLSKGYDPIILAANSDIREIYDTILDHIDDTTNNRGKSRQVITLVGPDRYSITKKISHGPTISTISYYPFNMQHLTDEAILLAKILGQRYNVSQQGQWNEIIQQRLAIANEILYPKLGTSNPDLGDRVSAQFAYAELIDGQWKIKRIFVDDPVLGKYSEKICDGDHILSQDGDHILSQDGIWSPSEIEFI